MKSNMYTEFQIQQKPKNKLTIARVLIMFLRALDKFCPRTREVPSPLPPCHKKAAGSTLTFFQSKIIVKEWGVTACCAESLCMKTASQLGIAGRSKTLRVQICFCFRKERKEFNIPNYVSPNAQVQVWKSSHLDEISLFLHIAFELFIGV